MPPQLIYPRQYAGEWRLIEVYIKPQTDSGLRAKASGRRAEKMVSNESVDIDKLQPFCDVEIGGCC